MTDILPQMITLSEAYIQVGVCPGRGVMGAEAGGGIELESLLAVRELSGCTEGGGAALHGLKVVQRFSDNEERGKHGWL